MPYCESCWFEYRRGIARCPDCGRVLVEGDLPSDQQPNRPSPREPSPDSEVVQLCHVADPIEAEVIQSILAGAGIASHLQTFGVLTAYRVRIADGPTPDYAIILVTRNRLEDARRVVERARSGRVQWPEGMEPEE